MENTSANILQTIQAFQVLATPNASQEILKQADTFISGCEVYPDFMLTLITIIQQTPSPQTKRQALIHLKTILKRNWTSKKKYINNTSLTPEIKQQTKNKLIQLYIKNWQQFYKDFNDIFKFLARHDFPMNYGALQNFVLEVLGTVGKLDMQSILKSNEVLPYLSLVKCVYKQHADRRILHSEQNYNKFIAGPVSLTFPIIQNLSKCLNFYKNNSATFDHQSMLNLFECSRKVDKIILYCVRCMVSSLQGNANIIGIVEFELGKIETLTSLLNQNNRELVEKNILGILQSVTKLQVMFPLLLTNLIHQYLQMIISLLFNHKFASQKLVNCILQSNINPFTCFTFYMNPQQFRQSIQYKQINQQAQSQCHHVYITVYNHANVQMFLEKIVGELMMAYRRVNCDDEIVFEDTEQTYEGSHQQGTFELIISLLKSILTKFPQQSQKFTSKLTTHLLTSQQNSLLTSNIFEVLLLLPKIEQHNNLEIHMILLVVEKCYVQGKYDLFCRFVRAYHEHVGNETVCKFYEILVSIIGMQGVNHHTIYQSAVCLKRILSHHKNIQFSVQKIGSCLSIMFSLIQTYKETPTHLWNLLNLLIQILKSLSTVTILHSLIPITNYVGCLANNKQNSGTIICAISQLLRNLLTLVAYQSSEGIQAKISLVSVSLKILETPPIIQPQDQQVSQSKYELWFSIIKTIHVSTCPVDIQQRLLKLMSDKKQQITDDNVPLFFCILQEYLISGILSVSAQELTSFYISLVNQTEPEHETQLNVAFFSLYLTYFILTNNPIPQLLQECMNKLQILLMKVSPSINNLRKLLMLVINYHVIVFGSQPVFKIFENQGQWWKAYVWSLQSINQKYVRKVVSIAILSSIPLLKNMLLQKIDQNLPFDFIIKLITPSVRPLNFTQCLHSYSQVLSPYTLHSSGQTKQASLYRPVKLHVNQTWINTDLSPVYQTQIGELFRIWDWGVDDLEERYTNEVVKSILDVLGGVL